MLCDQFRHALVIGKFYPPHLGHCYLIENAGTCAHNVTVVVMASHAEHLSLDVRVAWLAEHFKTQMHIRIVGVWDDLPVDYDDEVIWQAQVVLMREGIARAQSVYGLLPPVDAVFSSESYGDRLATYFDASSVVVNQGRDIVPISGTDVRENLIGNWHFLPQAVQSGLCHRIVIVGGESIGKTTLAKAIATQLNNGVMQASYVAEYGREYNSLKLQVMRSQANKQKSPVPSVFDCQWQTQEFTFIAQKQIQREQQASLMGCPYLICDTDAFATQFWHHRYMGYNSVELDAVVAQQPKRALYILPDINDVVFEQDGLRDGEHIRHEMHEAFRNALSQQTQTPWIEVKGSVDQRVAQAIKAIHDIHYEFEVSRYE